MKTKKVLLSLFAGLAACAYGQTTLSVTVNSSLDDHEERINGSVAQSGTLGNMDSGSSDLELGNEKPTADPQLVGVRFNSITIPANATIVNAYIQFTVDDFAKNTDPCNLTVQIEDNVNPATFSDNPFSLSTRSLITTSVNWLVSGSTWSTVGSSTPDQRTADIKTLVQAVVNKGGWASGNPMAFFIKGNGTREVESFDGDATHAPQLVVQYSVTTTGINEHLEKSSVTVYPNPFKNSFRVAIEIFTPAALTISVIDLTGKLVEEKYVEQPAVGTFYYNSISDLKPGMYFVKVRNGNKQEVTKIISE